MKNKLLSTEALLPCAALLLSIINITSYATSSIPNLCLSVVGIVGAALYFREHPWAFRLLYFWVLAQIVIIEPYIDLSQGIRLSFGFGLNDGGIYINIPMLVLFATVRVVEAAGYKGRKIILREFREGSIAGFPLTGTVTGRKTVGDEHNWLIVSPDELFSYDGRTVHSLLVKRKDNKTVKPGGKNQVSFFRLVYDAADLKSADAGRFPFIDWVYAGQ